MGDESDDDFDFEELRKQWQAARKKEFDFDEWAKVRNGFLLFY